MAAENLLVAPGRVLRTIRTERKWTLAEISGRTGIPVSSLSKIEQGKTELTMDRLLRISVALEVNIADLLGSPASEAPSPDRARRSITRLGEGAVVTSSYGDYAHHAQDLLDKKLSPMIALIRARSLEEFGDYHRHNGEEFLLVLEGELGLYTDTYAPIQLKAGESIYFDGGMGHAYVSTGSGPCRLAIVCAPSASLRVMQGAKGALKPLRKPAVG